jgi:hypothetical protein
VTEQGRAPRIARKVGRGLLRAAFSVLFLLGFFILCAPVMYVAGSHFELLYQKFAHAMGGTSVVVIIGLAMVALAAWIRRRLQKMWQAENDRVATGVLERLGANAGARVPEFYLYLRAFETTGRLNVPLFLRLRKLSIGFNSLVTNDLESYVSQAIGRVGPLVALGHPGETIGAGRILTGEENWKTDIGTLMKRAKGILLVPSDRPGTLWEIDTLKQEGLLGKVIFVMPPRSKGEHDTRQRWESARQALRDRGLETPDYDERGMLFVLEADGRVSNVEPLLLTSARKVRKSLKRLLIDAQPAGGLYTAIARTHRRIRRATFWGWTETLRQLSTYGFAALGLVIARPAVGFNPGESWRVVFERSFASQVMAEQMTRDALEIAGRYRSIAALVPPDKERAQTALVLLHGLTRIDDKTRRVYLTAFGNMLARVDTRTCAAIARDQIGSGEMRVALTYIQWSMDDFLRAAEAAISAGLDGKPGPSLDQPTAIAAAEQFIASLKPEDQERYERIVTSQGKMSDDDECWRARVDYSPPGKLAEADANTWATIVAVTAVARLGQGQATHEQAQTTPPAATPPAAPSRVAARNDRPERVEPPAQISRAPEPPARAAPRTPSPRPVAVPQRLEPGPLRTTVSNNAATSGGGHGPADPASAPRAGNDGNAGIVATGATAPPPAPAGGLAPAPRLTYARMFDGALAAIRAGRNAEAGELIDQLIETEPARSEGWALRGAMAMAVYDNLPVAYESYVKALARGGAVAFRLLHDHGSNQTPCGGTLTVTPESIHFDGGAGGHRFQWPFAAIREAAINEFYGSALGMFHIKAQMPDGAKNFNFAVVRPSDVQVVNRRADADMLLRIVNQRRSPVGQ